MFFFSIFHPFTFMPCESCIPSFPCCLCGIVPDVTLIWFPVCVACVNGWCYCLNGVFSLVPPPGEPWISPSHSQSFVPHVQIEKVNHTKDIEAEDQSASKPCIEVHAMGLRRCSEPLSYIPQQHQTKPPAETGTRLVITSEQRSLICFPQNCKVSLNQIQSKRYFFRSSGPVITAATPKCVISSYHWHFDIFVKIFQSHPELHWLACQCFRLVCTDFRECQ